MCSDSLFSALFEWRVWRSVLLGQFLAVLLCGTGITSQLLQATFEIHMPTAQSFLNYVFLCLIFTTWLACKQGDRGLVAVLRSRGWKYFILAIIDVEANFLVVKAYQYTTLTSIQLLDCFSIPTVLLLSWLCIKVRYGISHILGVCLALVGIGCLVYSDIDEATSNVKAEDRFYGDMLCISGAALYGVSNVAEEYVVKSYSIVEFLGMIGLFGSIVNGIQLAILEKEEVSAINVTKWEEISLLLGFSACLLLLYITMPLVLQISSSTAVNISLLTTDFYSLLIGYYLFQYKFNWLYLVSFGFILIGVLLYNLQAAPSSLSETFSFETSSLPGSSGQYDQIDNQASMSDNNTLDSSILNSSTISAPFNPYAKKYSTFYDSYNNKLSLERGSEDDNSRERLTVSCSLPRRPSPLGNNCLVTESHYTNYQSAKFVTKSQQVTSGDNCNRKQRTSSVPSERERLLTRSSNIPKFVWEDQC